MRHIYIWALLLIFACAEGSSSDTGDDESGSPSSGQGAGPSTGVGGSTSGNGGSTSGNGGASVGGSGGMTSANGGSGGSGCPPGETPCGIMCFDLQTDTNNCGGCGNICLLGESCSAGMCVGNSSSSVSSSVSSSTAATTVTVSSSSTGGGTCDPLSPSLVCGSNNHCIPQPNGIPVCTPPTGNGTQYSTCTTSATCGPIYECVNTGYLTVYCMQWCSTDFDCPGWPFDTCYALNPAVYVGSQEWGVCWDGLP